MITDPYEVLGVAHDATDEQIKNAYRELASKYHPDKYEDSPLKEVAEEKMKEVNEAYDMVIQMRKNGDYAGSGNYQRANSGSSQNPVLQKARSYIIANNLAAAEQLLNSVDTMQRTAEWYFLTGMLYSKKGWSEQAFQNLQRAVQMDPSNAEYSAAYNNVMRTRQYGPGAGYNQPNNNAGCNCCDFCAGMMCADMCCNCCGGC